MVQKLLQKNKDQTSKMCIMERFRLVMSYVRSLWILETPPKIFLGSHFEINSQRLKI
jgi:hypothetical protein